MTIDTSPPPRIRGWAAKPGPAKVLAEAKRRLEANPGAAGDMKVTLSDEERAQVAELLGLAWQVSNRAITFRALRASLAERDADLEALLGPLTDRRAQRAARLRGAESETTQTVVTLVAAGVPRAAAEALCMSRLLPPAGSGQRVATAKTLAKLWAALPTPQRPMSLAELAGAACSDPHALDANQALGRMTARLAATVAAASPTLAEVSGSEAWRDAWASINVTCDLVSSTVLTLNLGDAVNAPTGLFGVAGEPTWLTARALTRQTWRPNPPDPSAPGVYVCENPAVIEAAADRHGESCAPLVCTYGRPSLAAWRLLRRLADTGWALAVRADDDPTGQAIVATLVELPNTRLWRYRLRSPAHAAIAPVYEEQILTDLLDDLAAPSHY